MTSTGAIIVRPAESVQDFHLRVAPLHISMELKAPCKKTRTAATAALADVAAKPRTDDRPPDKVTTATPPTPNLCEDPLPTNTTG